MLAKRYLVLMHDGSLIGIEGNCRHMRASLADAEVADGVLTCPWHGWKYELPSGECLTLAGFRLRRFSVWVDGDNVWLDPSPVP